LGGAAAAACLAKIGFKVKLFEKSGELREIGAGIFVKQNGLQVLQALGCYDEIVAHGTWILRGELWDNRARKFVDRHLPEKRVIVVKRADLHATLVRAAVGFGVEITTGMEVSNATPDGRLTFENGQSVDADLVIGADGIGSAVRNSLGLLEYVRPTGNGSWRVLVPRQSDDPAAKVIEFWRGHRRILVTQSGDDATYVCASCRDDDAPAASDAFDRQVWASHFPEFRSLIERIEPRLTGRRQHTKVSVHAWHKGCVAILGDAVHGQPPNLGQGAGCAIANAGALADLLSDRTDIGPTLRIWEAERQNLTKQIQSFSNWYDDVVHAWPLTLEPLRTKFVAAIGAFKPTRMAWARLSAGLSQI